LTAEEGFMSHLVTFLSEQQQGAVEDVSEIGGKPTVAEQG
jgi:hypothetical protein